MEIDLDPRMAVAIGTHPQHLNDNPDPDQSQPHHVSMPIAGTLILVPTRALDLDRLRLGAMVA